MPWSGSSPNQTFGRTDGTRTGATTWQEADGAGVDIIATDHDTHDQDLAAGINAALKKDGGNQPSANLPMGGFRHTNVGVATALTQYLSATQAFQNVGRYVTTVGGTANAVTLTTGFSLAAYVEGMTFSWKVPAAITGPLTVNVDGLGVKSVLTLDGSELQQGEIRADFIPIITYDGTRFRWLNRPTSGSSGDVLARITPVGIVAPWPGTTAPSGWLLAYGQAVSRTTYAELFAAYGTTYGTGDGSTTFNLPDYRGRTPFGRDDMGGTAANRITTAGSSVDGVTLGAVGGAQNVTLTAAQMPTHTHTASVTDPTHAHAQTVTTVEPGVTGALTGGGPTAYAWDGNQNTGFAATGITVSNANAGSSAAHSNMPPAIVQNWIILALPALASASTTGVNGLLYRFSNSTTDAPGDGKIGFNDATLASATGFRISETDATGAPMGPVLATWDDNTSTTKGTLYVYKVGSLSTYAMFHVTGTMTDSGAFDSFSATYISDNGTFTDGDQLSVIYVARGDQGAPGAGIDWQGAWITDTSYAYADGVNNGGSSYICTSAHTSGATTEPGVGAAWATVWDIIAAKGADGSSGSGSGDLLAANNLSDVASAATAFSNIKQAASDTATGVVELATTAEATTGTDTTRAITAAGLKAHVDAAALAFKTIAVSGQSDVVADSRTDTLTLVAGTNVTITTDAGADSVTIAASGGGSDLTLISVTAVGSAVAQVDFTDLDTSTYDAIMVDITGLATTTDSNHLCARFGTGSGGSPTWISSGYEWTCPLFGYTSSAVYSSDAGSAVGSAVTDRMVLCPWGPSGNGLGSGSGKTMSAQYWITRLADSSYPRINGLYSLVRASDTRQQNGFAGGVRTTAAAHTALRFFMHSGNITAGTFRLYGLAKN